jgi:hypothetical protein
VFCNKSHYKIVAYPRGVGVWLFQGKITKLLLTIKCSDKNVRFKICEKMALCLKANECLYLTVTPVCGTLIATQESVFILKRLIGVWIFSSKQLQSLEGRR